MQFCLVMGASYISLFFIAILLSTELSVAQQKCASLIFSLAKPESPQEQTRFQVPGYFVERWIPFLQPSIKLEDFSFDGLPLSIAQLKALARFSSRARKPLIRGDRITTIRYEEMLLRVDSEIGVQRIEKNEGFEAKLIESSNVETNPIEVLTFRIHLLNGKIVEVPIKIKGDVNSVDFDKGSFELYSYLRGDVSNIQAIEIAHSHPTYAVRVQSLNGDSKFRANEISTEDYQAAISFARRIPPGKTVIIKAVVPNGFNYQMEIPTGR